MFARNLYALLENLLLFLVPAVSSVPCFSSSSQLVPRLPASCIWAVSPTIFGGSIYHTIITREHTFSGRNSCKSKTLFTHLCDVFIITKSFIAARPPSLFYFLSPKPFSPAPYLLFLNTSKNTVRILFHPLFPPPFILFPPSYRLHPHSFPQLFVLARSRSFPRSERTDCWRSADAGLM